VTTEAVDFDHHSLEYAQHGIDRMRELRERCPVAFTEAWEGYWLLTRYADVARVINDDATFSSARSAGGKEGVGITIPAAAQGAVPIDLDPPDNSPYRKLLNPVFSPARSWAWRPFLKEATTACIDRFIESGSGDLVLDVANPVPALLTIEMLGMPLEDWLVYAEPMHETVATRPGSEEHQAALAKMFRMFGLLAQAVADRRTGDGDDLISLIARAEVDGAPISDDVALQIVTLVLVGGVDTTTSLMANAFHWLWQHPEERERLRADPSLIPAAREEFLRFFTPTQGLARTVTCPVSVGDQKLSAGDRIFMSFAAANRDPEVFDRPDEVILDRFPNKHTTFGLGIHRCIGSNIARVEFDVVLEEVLRRLPDYEIDEARSERYDTVGVVNGWKQMPVTFTPAPKEGSSITL
jgi:cytochrome P450